MLGSGRHKLSHGHRHHIKCHPKLLVFLGILTVAQLLVLLVGARLYVYIEEPHEIDEQNAYHIQKRSLDNEFCNTFFPENQTRCDDALAAHDANLAVLRRYDVQGSAIDTDWDFWNAVIFMASTTTTVGWGVMTPETKSGQILSIVFIIFGIPMSLTLFGIIGVYLKRLVHHLVFHTASYLDLKPHTQIPYHRTSMFVAIVMTFVYMVLVGQYYQSDHLNAGGDVFGDQDPMWRCFYFTVISFSTVGYGDFLVQADQDNRGLNTLGFVVTLYVGISFFSLFLATLQHMLEAKIEKAEHLDTEGIADGKEMRMSHVENNVAIASTA